MCLVPLVQAAFSPDTDTRTQFLCLCFADVIENKLLILSERTPHYSVCKYWCISLCQWLTNTFSSCYPGWFYRYPDKILTRFLRNNMTRKIPITLSKPFSLLPSGRFFLWRIHLQQKWSYPVAQVSLAIVKTQTSSDSNSQNPEHLHKYNLNVSASTWPGTQLAASLWWHMKKHTRGPSGSE